MRSVIALLAFALDVGACANASPDSGSGLPSDHFAAATTRQRTVGGGNAAFCDHVDGGADIDAPPQNAIIVERVSSACAGGEMAPAAGGNPKATSLPAVPADRRYAAKQGPAVPKLSQKTQGPARQQDVSPAVPSSRSPVIAIATYPPEPSGGDELDDDR